MIVAFTSATPRAGKPPVVEMIDRLDPAQRHAHVVTATVSGCNQDPPCASFVAWAVLRKAL